MVIPDEAKVEVSGSIWQGATEVVTFTDADESRSRVFYRKQNGENYRTYPASQVRILTSATHASDAADVLNYWRSVAFSLGDDDPLRQPYDELGFVHPDSALSTFLVAAPIKSRPPAAAPIFPFRCNLSQRQAVENGLTNSISVIEGPPGTGKTETILNLIANIIAVRHETVGVVSFGNAAVDNVREKLDELGFGHMIANLGRRGKRAVFFTGQLSRNSQVRQFVASAPDPPDPERLADVDGRLRRLQDAERSRAELRQLLDAYSLEWRHFEQHLMRDEVPQLTGRSLLRRSSDRILDYLVDSEMERAGVRPGLVRRIRKYFRYGSLRDLDPDDTRVVLRLQQAFYNKRISELQIEVERVESQLRRGNFNKLADDQQKLSIQMLHAELGARYRNLACTTYNEETYKLGTKFSEFAEDYPLLLSTCHSLRRSMAPGYLLDYLIIDESSQVDVVLAGLAMSACRNLIVVGDQKQLSPIPSEVPTRLVPPSPAYDCKNNLLASLSELYGDRLPRVLLREHYRCDPSIIGFCNEKFYEGKLIPYTMSGRKRPMIVVRTVEGNHMRQHRGGGRSNQREIDVIASEVIPTVCPGVESTNIGVTTPYRLQASKASDVLDQSEADTIHRFQGRQKEVVIFTTVLDETWRGRTGLSFVDDPRMINVAVSRAVQQFILVTNKDMLPASRHISDLVGYIRYHNPGEEVVDSAVISMFDLLYGEYSERLRPLAARLRKELKYKSEDIIWTGLHDILAEPLYMHLTARSQVLLRNLLPDVSRLNPEQQAYVQHRASVDFVVFNRVTKQSLLAIEVDGFAFHENNPDQLRRDALKNDILGIYQMPLLRLPTTGSGEDQRIREALNNAEEHGARLSML
nr:AAA domain-containing protein [Actinopolymorpha cephalotaxi]